MIYILRCVHFLTNFHVKYSYENVLKRRLRLFCPFSKGVARKNEGGGWNHLTEARQCFWHHSRTAGPIWPNFSWETTKKYQFGTFWWFPQLVLFGGFPAGNKGVFWTTGDRGRNFFGGLWIPYGYPKISDPLQNRRLLPLKRLSWNFQKNEI